jgi:hypothetical protein
MLVARAIAGTHVVILAWDLKPNKKAKLAGLLGFALQRSELKPDGSVLESYWMRGIKRFKDKDKGLPPGTPVSTADHPIQTFQWGDYTAKSDRHYRYRIVPLYGQPKLLQPDDASAVELDVHTEPDTATVTAANANSTRHDIYFNRGVIGSQAYARDFDNAAPDEDDPQSPEMVWLSHGLYEALLGFVGLAKNQSFGLRAAVYEFHYQPVVNAFAAAVDAGADVKVVYDAASSYKTPNEEAIGDAGLDAHGAVIKRTVSEGLRHNKFIVLLQNGQPKRCGRLDQHFGQRDLRTLERRTRRLGQGRRTEVPRLLERAVAEQDVHQAAADQQGGDAHPRRKTRQEQRHRHLQCPRYGERHGGAGDAAVVCGSHGGREGARVLHRRIQH